MPLAIERHIRNYVEKNHPFFSTSVDNHLKWIPFATVFAVDLFGVKTRSNWKKEILLVAATESIRYMITDTLKKITHEDRPGPSMGHHSFPSGHTASSFAGAEIMRMELKQAQPVLCYSGYAAATITGILRLYKNKHWLTDVIGGAVAGVLSARLAYFLLRKRRKQKPKQPLGQDICQ